jgi:hypothetical protein
MADKLYQISGYEKAAIYESSSVEMQDQERIVGVKIENAYKTMPVSLEFLIFDSSQS